MRLTKEQGPYYDIKCVSTACSSVVSTNLHGNSLYCIKIATGGIQATHQSWNKTYTMYLTMTITMMIVIIIEVVQLPQHLYRQESMT